MPFFLCVFFKDQTSIQGAKSNMNNLVWVFSSLIHFLIQVGLDKRFDIE